MDSAELINSEINCLEQWQKAIKITADKTKFMLFSFNKNIRLPRQATLQ